MNLPGLSPALKAATGLAVGAAFAGAVALTASGGHRENATFNAGTIDVMPTAFVEKRPTTPAPLGPTPATNATPVYATALATPGPRKGPEACPKDWQFFDNTLLKYTLCVPSEWGFADAAIRDRLPLDRASSTLSARQGALLVMSADGFPLPLGQTIAPAEAARYANAIRLSVTLIQQGTGFGGCTPNQPRNIAGLTGLYCDDAFSLVAGGDVKYSPSGDLRERKVLIPWMNASPSLLAPKSLATSGYFLFVKVDSSASRFLSDAALIDQVIDNVRGYQ